MEALTLFCTVSVSDAIAAGTNRAGRVDYLIGEGMCSVAELQRAGLHEAARPYIGVPSDPPGRRLPVAPNKSGDITWVEIHAALKAVKESDSTIRRRRAAELEFVDDNGDQSQMARAHDGTLPESEFVGLLRQAVFLLFDRHPRYDSSTRLGPKAVHHKDGCKAKRDVGWESAPIFYETMSGAELTAGQHSAYQQLLCLAARVNGTGPIDGPAGDGEIAPYDAFRTPLTVELKHHIAECIECRARARSMPTVLVSCTWFGRALSREYVL